MKTTRYELHASEALFWIDLVTLSSMTILTRRHYIYNVGAYITSMYMINFEFMFFNCVRVEIEKICFAVNTFSF